MGLYYAFTICPIQRKHRTYSRSVYLYSNAHDYSKGSNSQKIKQNPHFSDSSRLSGDSINIRLTVFVWWFGSSAQPETPALVQTQPTPTTTAPAITPSPTQTQVSTGDIIQFGPYNWRVLDVQGNQALIITDRVIESRMYHHTFEAVTWETNEIRRWLNNEFLSRLSAEEQARVAQTTVVNHDNP